MGPASVSSACLLLTVAKKSIIAAGFLGTPKSGHAVKLNWYTSRDPSPCETQQHVNFAKFNNKKKKPKSTKPYLLIFVHTIQWYTRCFNIHKVFITFWPGADNLRFINSWPYHAKK